MGRICGKSNCRKTPGAASIFIVFPEKKVISTFIPWGPMVTKAGKEKQRMWVTGKGFTLPELLIVLAIAAGAMAIAAPRLQAALQTYTLKQHCAEIAALLRHARSKAMREGRETRVVFNLEARSYQLEGVQALHKISRDIDIALRLAKVQGDTPQMRFRPDGSASGGDIDLSNERIARRVTVSWLTGRTTIVAIPGED
jgi:general secretion pathway protein H